jgi:type IV pilus assembly protein PilB
MTLFSREQVLEGLFGAEALKNIKIRDLLAEEKACDLPFGRLLIKKGLTSENRLIEAMSERLRLPKANLQNLKIDAKAVSVITHETARRCTVMPIAKQGKQIIIATADPFNLTMMDDLSVICNAEILPVLATHEDISNAIDRHYCKGTDHDNSAEISGSPSEISTSSDLQASGRDASVIRTVNALIRQAIKEGASDIHLEPSEDGLRIRMRLDGILHDLGTLQGHKQAHIISRVKIMANLDIAERRLPQDGNIQLQNENGDINLRVSTMPTILGEKIVIRLLEKERIVLPLEGLGFSKNNYQAIRRLLLNQAGMILVTGPTGCGKTTTLYSSLHYLNRPEDNIITVEDPVECRLKGINQIQVNRRINRTFANTLRSILRQDPNIIMVGEIRDLETAKIATQAALTGHLVLSTLHTNNAAGAVTRLIDMGLEPYLVTSSLVAIIAQRLIRVICPHCRVEYELQEAERHFFENFFQRIAPLTLYRGAKCSNCKGTGYRGRTSIQELLLLNGELQQLIQKGATAVTVQEVAIRQGMLPLIRDGLRCLEAGITTLSEVVRTTFSSVVDSQSSGYSGSDAFIDQLKKFSD